jgi:hypothetical protein
MKMRLITVILGMIVIMIPLNHDDRDRHGNMNQKMGHDRRNDWTDGDRYLDWDYININANNHKTNEESVHVYCQQRRGFVEAWGRPNG